MSIDNDNEEDEVLYSLAHTLNELHSIMQSSEWEPVLNPHPHYEPTGNDLMVRRRMDTQSQPSRKGKRPQCPVADRLLASLPEG